MKIFAIPRKTAVAVVVVWTVLGALLGHDYPTAGLVVSLGSIGYYLLLVELLLRKELPASHGNSL